MNVHFILENSMGQEIETSDKFVFDPDDHGDDQRVISEQLLNWLRTQQILPGDLIRVEFDGKK
jgi:hypothetical protein